MPLPRAADRTDPANRVLAIAAIVALCVVTPTVVFVQQFLRALADTTLESPLQAQRASEVAGDPGFESMVLRCKLLVMELDEANRRDRRVHKTPIDETLDDGELITAELERLAVSRAERLRLAVVQAELFGKDFGLERLAALAAEITPGSDLAADLGWLKVVYEQGPVQAPAEAREALTDRHGWFGRLALVYDLPESSPERQRVIGSLDAATGVEVAHILFRLLSLLVGLGVLVLALIWISRGELTGNFDADAVGGPVYLEAFVIWLIGLMVLLLSSIPFRGSSQPGAVAGLVVSEVLSWGMIGAMLWPLARGVSRQALAIDLGLHSGEGFFKEALCGAGGFLVSSAVLVLVHFAVSAVEGLSGLSEDASDPSTRFPLFEQPLSGSWVVILISSLGSVVWAPIYEEIAYRGALYRALHRRLRWIGAACVTALIFGATHPYDLPGLINVTVLGFVFAMLREWRSSLIAPIVAHFLHNGVISAYELSILRAFDY